MVSYRLNGQVISLELPDATKKEMDFSRTSFFAADPGRQLPAPSEILALSSDAHQIAQPKPVIIEDLNLVVKFGPYVTAAEALNPWMIRHVFHEKVPVPEVFGWRVDGQGFGFIYMELIRGLTVSDCYSTLTDAEKQAIADQLREILDTLRQLRQDPADQFVGSITRQHLFDYVLQCQPRSGPFLSVEAFNDWFALLHQLRFEHRYEDPNRCLLPDAGDITFTHADLNRGNIILSSRSPLRITLVDFSHTKMNGALTLLIAFLTQSLMFS
ncbi:hypothetical protein P170DRAFT_449010 [Aspergillus steynii IBT 23096]|uniref:Aminoglycoside phosphotransferase domain-containing protein n=1 Tax=Aspergillus steynii IBT 23096 TaxID=1392250 RepID=A0A2I2G3F5_9EURO|nr:uncharacterized protein P170DRAFT_449010 [Aspergillus steynii IBT 23096]PLB47387.1 hypothetical protein P170DRAFT_449010 [Aspergillus steynii IBT 23096]